VINLEEAPLNVVIQEEHETLDSDNEKLKPDLTPRKKSKSKEKLFIVNKKTKSHVIN
jgi:hypothetical protein